MEDIEFFGSNPVVSPSQSRSFTQFKSSNDINNNGSLEQRTIVKSSSMLVQVQSHEDEKLYSEEMERMRTAAISNECEIERLCSEEMTHQKNVPLRTDSSNSKKSGACGLRGLSPPNRNTSSINSSDSSNSNKSGPYVSWELSSRNRNVSLINYSDKCFRSDEDEEIERLYNEEKEIARQQSHENDETFKADHKASLTCDTAAAATTTTKKKAFPKYRITSNESTKSADLEYTLLQKLADEFRINYKPLKTPTLSSSDLSEDIQLVPGKGGASIVNLMKLLSLGHLLFEQKMQAVQSYVYKLNLGGQRVVLCDTDSVRYLFDENLIFKEEGFGLRKLNKVALSNYVPVIFQNGPKHGQNKAILKQYMKIIQKEFSVVKLSAVIEKELQQLSMNAQKSKNSDFEKLVQYCVNNTIASVLIGRAFHYPSLEIWLNRLFTQKNSKQTITTDTKNAYYHLYNEITQSPYFQQVKETVGNNEHLGDEDMVNEILMMAGYVLRLFSGFPLTHFHTLKNMRTHILTQKHYISSKYCAPLTHFE